MIRINLLSEGRQPAVAKRRSVDIGGSGALGNWVMLLLLAAGLIAGLVHFLMLRSDLGKMNDEVAEAQVEVNRLAPIIKEVEEFKAKKTELQRKIGVIRDLRANQRGPVHVMDEISRALPELMWLTSMSQKANKVTLQGEAYNTNAVATFIDNLDNVPEFQEPNLRDTNRKGKAGTTAFRFVIDFNYTPRKTVSSEASAKATE